MSKDEWFSLPLNLRQRYWRETNYGKIAPPAKLAEEIDAVLLARFGEQL